MNKKYLKKFMKASMVRMVKTFAQTFLTLCGTNASGYLTLDYLKILSISLITAILSLLTSLAGLPEVKEDEKNKKV